MLTARISGAIAGRLLRVDLSRNLVQIEESEEYARRFLGGRAVNSLILLNETRSETRWSDPDNLLIFGAGCLVGTMAPGANRVSVETKSAWNGGKGSANFGGHFGPELKFAGFDQVVISGRAEKPVYLWISDGQAEIRRAESVWGKSTYETEEILRAECHDKRIKVATIGPAGENLVKSACIIGDMSRAAGGSGVGAVMGSKNLKALAVRGHGAIYVADPIRFMDKIDECRRRFASSTRTASWRKGIIRAAFFAESPVWDLAGEMGRNGLLGYWPPEKRQNLVGEERGVPKYQQKTTACFNCPAGCNIHLRIDEGPYAGTQGSGYWIGSATYSQRFDVDDAAASIKFHLTCNQLGVSGDAAAAALSWAFECYEKGLLTKEETGGLELTWGNGEAMNSLLTDLAYRKGLGDLLAEGTKAAAAQLGRGSEALAVHLKEQDTNEAYRIQKGWGLGCSTSTNGPQHLRGAVGTPYHSGPPDLPRATTGYENQPAAVFWQVLAKEIEDMTGLCNMMGTYTGPHVLGPADYTDLVNLGLGLNHTEDSLTHLGQAGFNLEKAFNTLHTPFGRKDDYPPHRFEEVPIEAGPYAGFRCDRAEWDRMLDELYRLHGWDVETGLQTRQGLTALGLDDIAALLEGAGKLQR